MKLFLSSRYNRRVFAVLLGAALTACSSISGGALQATTIHPSSAPTTTLKALPSILPTSTAKLDQSSLSGRILFSAGPHPHQDIYVINADGSDLTQLTDDPAADSDPAWSPDNTRIAFRSRRHGNDEIYLMNADGSGQTNLTNHPAMDLSPAWSPDNSRIAFASSREEGMRLPCG